MNYNKRTLTLEYQLYTKCNLKCAYCYNYFDEGVRGLDFYKGQLDEIMKLCHDYVFFVINGGEPFLFKDLAHLVNHVTNSGYMVSTYTNGTLPIHVYDRFLSNLAQKDYVFLTVSIHFDEVLVDGRFTNDYLASVERLASEIPLLKLNVVVTEKYSQTYLAGVLAALTQLHECCPSVRYLNFLVDDALYEQPMKLAKVCSSAEFRAFTKAVDDMFGYRNCAWDNCRTLTAEMMAIIGQNALRAAAGTMALDLPVDTAKHELTFLVKGDRLVIETSMTNLNIVDIDVTDTPDAFSIGTIPASKLQAFVERNKEIVHSVVPKPIDHIREISKV